MRFGQLGEWDAVMQAWEGVFHCMISSHQFISLSDDKDKMIVYERGELIFVFNFHPQNSYTDYLIGTNWTSDLMILYESDEERFSGHRRLNEGHNKWCRVLDKPQHNRRCSFSLYVPSRCAIVLVPFEFAIKYKEV